MRKSVDDLIEEHGKLSQDYERFMDAYEKHIGKSLDGLKSLHYVAIAAMAIVLLSSLLMATGLVSVEHDLTRWFLLLCICVGTFGELASKRMTKKYGNINAKLPKNFVIHMEQGLEQSNQLKKSLSQKIDRHQPITQSDILQVAKDAQAELKKLSEKIEWILDDEDEAIKNGR